MHLGHLQQELLLATEKERSATEIAVECKTKVKSLDVQVKSLKEEKIKLEFSLEDETNKRKELDESVQK